MTSRILISSFALATLFLSGETQSFQRYQVILDKNMFGRPAPTPAPKAAPVVQPPTTVSWAKDFRVTMMVRDHETGQVQVGLQNVKDNSGVLLRSGDAPERNRGYSLVRTDFDNKIAVVAYQGVQQQFTQQAGPTVAVAQPAGTAGTARSTVSNTSKIRRPVVRRSTPRPVTPRLSGQELEKHLQDYNEKVIREGLPPLPVPLTPDQDARLVRDGILPPQ